MEALQINKENIHPKKSIFNGSNFQQQLNKLNKSQKVTSINSSTSKNQNIQNNIKDPKVQKSLVDLKIQQLHDKMKDFFNSQRKTHYSQIGPQIEELQKNISMLRAQLNRPKSNEQIQAQRIQLMNRKTNLLIQLQKLSKSIKQNKMVMISTNIQKEELQRQIKSANAIITIYKIKIQKKKSLLEQSNSSMNKSANFSQQKQDQAQSQINLDKIHITQIQVSEPKKGLPKIKKGPLKVASTWVQSQKYQNALNHSNISSFSNYSPSGNHDALKSSRFQLSTQLKIYAKKLNNETWNQVEGLFQSLKDNKFQKLSQLLIDELRKKQSIKYHEKGYGKGFNGSKTHQMKLQIRKIFKNYKTDQFFNQAMSKKTVKKQLNEIFRTIQNLQCKNDKK